MTPAPPMTLHSALRIVAGYAGPALALLGAAALLELLFRLVLR